MDIYNHHKLEYLPENIFLIFAIIFGIGFVFITPPFQAPDEIIHFYIAYEFSDFNNILKLEQDKYIPESLVMTTNAFEDIPFHSERKISVDKILNLINIPSHGSVADNKVPFKFNLYSPIPYVPQIVGISIGKIFDLSPLVMMYFGRIINLVSWILLVYFTIKISPVAKWLFFLIALIPMSLFQSASLSPDAVTNGISFLAISMVLYYSLDDKKQRINKYDIFLIFLISSILSLSKQVYFVIPLLFILIPIKKFNSKKEYISILALLSFLIILLDISWYLHIKDSIMEQLPERIPVGVSMSGQFRYIINNPLSYISILINTIHVLGRFYINSFIGILGWLDTRLSGYIYDSYIPILLLVSIFDKRKDITINWKMRCIFGAVFCSIFILIMTSLYMTWTKVGSELVSGVQGRYFIPIAPLLFMLLYNNQKIFDDSSKKKLQVFVICYSSIVLLNTMSCIIQRYYL